MSEFSAIIPTPIGNVGVVIYHNKLSFIKTLVESFKLISPQNVCAKQVVAQLNEYFFHDPKHYFDLPIYLTGTELQKKTWLSLNTIMPGSTITYSELAKQMDTHPRAIGNTCRHNPIPIILPCHRVIAKNSLGGYCGKTSGKYLTIKQWLLEHEKTKAKSI